MICEGPKMVDLNWMSFRATAIAETDINCSLSEHDSMAYVSDDDYELEINISSGYTGVLCVDNDTAIGVISRISMVRTQNESENTKHTHTHTDKVAQALQKCIQWVIWRDHRNSFFFALRSAFRYWSQTKHNARPRQLIWLTYDKRGKNARATTRRKSK